MVKISGVVYLIIGFVVSAYSIYVQSKVNNPSLYLFLGAGIIFIIIGIFKILKKYILGETEKKIKSQEKDPLLSKLYLNKDLAAVTANHNKAQNNAQILNCPKCGTRHYATSNFCHICGTRLK